MSRVLVKNTQFCWWKLSWGLLKLTYVNVRSSTCHINVIWHFWLRSTMCKWHKYDTCQCKCICKFAGMSTANILSCLSVQPQKKKKKRSGLEPQMFSTSQTSVQLCVIYRFPVVFNTFWVNYFCQRSSVCNDSLLHEASRTRSKLSFTGSQAQ